MLAAIGLQIIIRNLNGLKPFFNNYRIESLQRN